MNIKEWLNFYAFDYLNITKYEYIYNLETIISFILKIKKKYIFMFENKIISFKKFIVLNKILFLIKKGIPLPYLIKNIEFYSINFKLNSKVFIPRFDTESLIDFIIYKLNKNNNIKYNIIDLGTGIGSIAITLAKKLPKSNIIGIDINGEAIKFARINSNILNVKNVFFIKKSWFDYKSNNKFDIIISNPPYISEYEFNVINKYNKILHEPKESLISKYNGFYDIFFIIKKFSNFIKNNGFMLIEHGYSQGKIVNKIFKYNNFSEIETFNDLNGNNRFTYAKKIY